MPRSTISSPTNVRLMPSLLAFSSASRPTNFGFSILQNRSSPASRLPPTHRSLQARIFPLRQHVPPARPTDRELSKFIAQIFDSAIELASVVAYPVEILPASPLIDLQQVFFVAQPLDNHVMHE